MDGSKVKKDNIGALAVMRDEATSNPSPYLSTQPS